MPKEVKVEELKVELFSKDEILSMIDRMLEDCAYDYSRAKAPRQQRHYKTMNNFYGSIRHCLKEGT